MEEEVFDAKRRDRMSIFSDYECGAMSDVEFHNECVRMNAEDRDDQEREPEEEEDDESV